MLVWPDASWVKGGAVIVSIKAKTAMAPNANTVFLNRVFADISLMFNLATPHQLTTKVSSIKTVLLLIEVLSEQIVF